MKKDNKGVTLQPMIEKCDAKYGTAECKLKKGHAGEHKFQRF